MRLILLGAPGAGKGTQAVNLSKELHIPHISTGDIFRANIREGTELGLKAKTYIDAGKLVPDTLTMSIVEDRLQKDDCRNGFLFDGFPRTIPQAESLEDVLAGMNMELDAVISLDVPNEVIVRRMAGRRVCKNCGRNYHIVTIPPKQEGICDKCGGPLIIRDDDREETVLERLKTYTKKTEPLIGFYEKRNLLLHFDGTKDILETTREIMDCIKGQCAKGV
ncbi:MAG: adenylate kinase [Clostridiaceae bacterium]|jgi:adenylate kinase|nr:adenylate kinase [Clostridiaceae bacterium]